MNFLQEKGDSKMDIEIDCPYCEIRNTHAGAKFIKSKR